MPGPWRPGDVILMEAFLGRTRAPQLIDVRPQVVVYDGDDYLAVLSQPGSTWMTRDVPGRTAMTVEDRIALYLKEELRDDWYERTLSGAVLTLHPPAASYCVRLFWDSEWQFRFWYVNLEDPYVRTRRGIQVNDHTLDIVATADFEWSWKDEPEFEALVQAGSIPAEQAVSIREEGRRAIRRIEAREWPFDQPWPDWRPDPRWPVPRIADYWRPGQQDR